MTERERFIKYLQFQSVDRIPIFLEAGMDGTHPCEVAAGSDPVLLRRKYPQSALMGGLDKRAIANGRDGVDSELRRIQPLLKEGAYIPLLDHFVPPDVSYQTYLYYVRFADCFPFASCFVASAPRSFGFRASVHPRKRLRLTVERRRE